MTPLIQALGATAREMKDSKGHTNGVNSVAFTREGEELCKIKQITHLIHHLSSLFLLLDRLAVLLDRLLHSLLLELGSKDTVPQLPLK